MANGRLEDFYSLLSFLKPNILGSWKEFAFKYLIQRQLPGSFVSIITGYRNSEELLNIVNKYSYRVTKKECLDLPDKLADEIIEIELEEKKKYKEAVKDFIDEYDITIPNPLTKVLKLRQLCSGFVIDEKGELYELKSNKLSILEEFIEGILPKKVVIFCEFKHSIKQIENMLNKKKIKFVTLNGEQTDKNIWKKFQEDESILVFLAQYKSANAGIDLFASSYMIFYEPTLSTTVIEQAKDRIHRVGTTEACSYYWLITKNTIEESIYSKLSKHEDFNKKCLETFRRDLL